MPSSVNKFVWYDVMTTDTKASEAFYKRVIGWDTKDSGMSEQCYTLLSVGPTMVGGLMPIPEDARKAGLYLSEEPDRRLYTEPGILAVKPEDGTLYAAWVQSTPHARPHFEEVLSAVENMLAKDLPKPKGAA